jgi:hypothetical protein
MRVRLDQPARLDDFVAFLRACGAIAFRCNQSTAEVLSLSSGGEHSEDLAISAYLSSWRAYRPDVTVQQVEVFELPISFHYGGKPR